MPKRSRSDIDKYYQWFYAWLDSDNVQTYFGSVEIRLPVIPTQYIGAGSSVIYELLWAEFHFIPPADVTDNEEHDYGFGLMLEDRDSFIDTYLSYSNTIALYEFHRINDFDTNGRSREHMKRSPYIYNFQDEKGNGRLIARNNIFLFLHHHNTAAGNITTQLNFRCAYRLVKIPLKEYIGLLTEQGR